MSSEVKATTLTSTQGSTAPWGQRLHLLQLKLLIDVTHCGP